MESVPSRLKLSSAAWSTQRRDKPPRLGSSPIWLASFVARTPTVSIIGNGAAHHLLGVAAIIGVRAVDEIDPGLARLGDNPRRGRLIGRSAEHHGAQADRRNL